ncbi:MAG: siroheme synthase CysG [Gammaproteobacteria bacterium]|jgi:uroporphyrin-III C-methyltransferase/precorrin-2 dehydrogenase/sirohydrochlorin ferrochelatase
MKYLPLFFDIKGRPCLVVGGGEIAARKVEALLRAGARITVVSPQLGPPLGARHAAGEIGHLAEAFDAGHLADCVLAVAATDDDVINRRVSDLARKRRIPVNVVDHPELCSFIFPSVIDRSPVTVAVSTAGAAPVLARLLRARLETLIPATYGRLAELAGRFRHVVKARLPQGAVRRRFWEETLQGPVAELVHAGREAAAAHALQAALDKADTDGLRCGEVYLVGAGPGDPDLLSFRALRLMQQCDVVLYDRLVQPAILDLVRREAERIYVGKRRSFHSVRQEEINALLVKLARDGKRVLRLKGGDPFIFGRGGEEIATLADEGIPFQIVPGISAANGCAAYAGIPLTHRDFAQSVLFVTGHLKDGSMDLNWDALIQPAQTLVVYMGLSGLDILCRELIAHGMAAAMPAALVERGTTAGQRVLIGSLESLPAIVAKQDVHAPTLLIIGGVVKLHDSLEWFGK